LQAAKIISKKSGTKVHWNRCKKRTGIQCKKCTGLIHRLIHKDRLLRATEDIFRITKIVKK